MDERREDEGRKAEKTRDGFAVVHRPFVLSSIGFLMVTVGFIAAALAAVVEADGVRWFWYVPALAAAAAGVAAVRVESARHSKTEHHVVASIEAVESSLGRISANVKKLNNEKHSIHTYDMRHRIDELFVDDLDTFVDARESIAHRYGLAAYGEVMSSFAAGERYLNRVWSASADGYIDEVNEYLDKAQEQFSETDRKMRQLKIEN